jgi:hypothetical protein
MIRERASVLRDTYIVCLVILTNGFQKLDGTI